MRRLLLGLVVVLAGVGQARGTIYSVTDLGDLPGGENRSQAMAVNNLGQVVGLSEVAGGSAAPYGRTISSTTMSNYETMVRLVEAW